MLFKFLLLAVGYFLVDVWFCLSVFPPQYWSFSLQLSYTGDMFCSLYILLPKHQHFSFLHMLFLCFSWWYVYFISVSIFSLIIPFQIKRRHLCSLKHYVKNYFWHRFPYAQLKNESYYTSSVLYQSNFDQLTLHL